MSDVKVMDFRFVDFLEILKIKITLNNLQVDLLRFVLFPRHTLLLQLKYYPSLESVTVRTIIVYINSTELAHQLIFNLGFSALSGLQG